MPLLYLRFNPHHYWVDGTCYATALDVGHAKLWAALEGTTSVRPGVNLLFVQYDTTEGTLDIFRDDEDNDYAKLYEGCVIGC